MSCVVKISGNHTGGGKYTGKLVQFGDADVATTGNLTAADFGKLPDTDNCLILNPAEEGLDTHDLEADSFHPGVLRRINADGTYVVMLSPPGDPLPEPGAPFTVLTSSGTYGPIFWDYIRIQS